MRTMLKKMRDGAALSTGSILSMVVAVVIVSALVTVVASNVTTAKNDPNLTTSEKTMLGLLVLGFIIAPVVAIFAFARSK